MQYIKIVLISLSFLLIQTVSAQFKDSSDPSQNMATDKISFQKQYEKNIRKTRIDGVYIPADLEEAFEELSTLAAKEGIAKFKSAPEEIISRKLHFGLGRWISINWNLEEGSRYEYYLKNLGLVNVDDMVQFTIVSWHRHLLNKNLEVKERVDHYKKIQEKRLADRLERAEVLKTEIRAYNSKE